jgi:hypothetical protein
MRCFTIYVLRSLVVGVVGQHLAVNSSIYLVEKAKAFFNVDHAYSICSLDYLLVIYYRHRGQ